MARLITKVMLGSIAEFITLIGGGLVKDDISIVIVNNKLNSGGVHFEALAERTRLTHEYAPALA